VCVCVDFTRTSSLIVEERAEMSEKVQRSKLHRKTNVSPQRHLSDSTHSMVPAIPLVPPIVHTATYRVNSVEHYQEIASQVSAINNTLCLNET